MKYAHPKIAEAQAHIVELDRDVAVLARALESRDQADRKLITGQWRRSRRNAGARTAISQTCFYWVGTPLELTG
jgi:hypothetical protein